MELKTAILTVLIWTLVLCVLAVGGTPVRCAEGDISCSSPVSHGLQCDERRQQYRGRGEIDRHYMETQRSACQAALLAYNLNGGDSHGVSSSRQSVHKFTKCNRIETKVADDNGHHENSVPYKEYKLLINALVDVELLFETMGGLRNIYNLPALHNMHNKVSSVLRELRRLTCSARADDVSGAIDFYVRQRHRVGECFSELSNLWKVEKSAPILFYHLIAQLSNVDLEALHHYLEQEFA